MDVRGPVAVLNPERLALVPRAEQRPPYRLAQRVRVIGDAHATRRFRSADHRRERHDVEPGAGLHTAPSRSTDAPQLQQRASGESRPQ